MLKLKCITDSVDEKFNKIQDVKVFLCENIIDTIDFIYIYNRGEVSRVCRTEFDYYTVEEGKEEIYNE